MYALCIKILSQDKAYTWVFTHTYFTHFIHAYAYRDTELGLQGRRINVWEEMRHGRNTTPTCTRVGNLMVCNGGKSSCGRELWNINTRHASRLVWQNKEHKDLA